MIEEINIPAFVFKPIYSKNTSSTTIKRKDDILKIQYPYFNKEEVLDIATKLSMKTRNAHDRSIDEVIDIIEQVGDLWRNPTYEFRKEALKILPMLTGQSKKLCEFEMLGSFILWKRETTELQIKAELRNKKFLDDWLFQDGLRLHVQPRGLVLHNLAGNAFNVGVMSLYFGLVSKNVNLVKLSHDEPYFTIKLAESIAEVDKKIARELAVIYWKGIENQIFDDLFKSGYINSILAWGGLHSIENIKRRAYYYGINIIDNGPKMSFSIVSDELFRDPNKMREIAQKIANDAVIWNQRACVSPRVVYIINNPPKNVVNMFNNISQNMSSPLGNVTTNQKNANIKQDLFYTNLKLTIDSLSEAKENNLNYREQFKKSKNNMNMETTKLDKNIDNKKNNNNLNSDNINELLDIMQRSMKIIRDELTETSPITFAKMLATAMANADRFLPPASFTESDGIETIRKREYFSINYEFSKNGILFTPPNDDVNWSVLYLRIPPNIHEIDKCQNRFIIVTHVYSLEDLIHFFKEEKMQHYLQTISIYGNDDFVKTVAEELSLIGANRFPKPGEHNIVKIGTPWDGRFILNELVRWVTIEFPSSKAKIGEKNEDIEYKVNFFGDH
ncbi:MAG: acyl-CoA reductase [Promethearchaeota archaeon]